MATSRERLRALLDAVPEERLDAAQDALERLTDPVVLAFLNAPEDDEPTTAEDLAALDQARAELHRGESMSLEAVLADLDA